MSGSTDIEGQCNAHLYIGDDYGDNHATMRCGEPKGHSGLHRDVFTRSHGGQPSECVVTWEQDERCWHEWVELMSQAGKEIYLQQWADDEAQGLIDPYWIERYNEIVTKYGDKYICRKCFITERST